MPIYKCSQCLPTNIPDDWTNEKKSETASLTRNLSPLQAIQKFRPIEMSLVDAKNISFHITKEKGYCHNCKTKLIEYEGNCPKCNRLNLD